VTVHSLHTRRGLLWSRAALSNRNDVPILGTMLPPPNRRRVDDRQLGRTRLPQRDGQAPQADATEC